MHDDPIDLEPILQIKTEMGESEKSFSEGEGSEETQLKFENYDEDYDDDVEVPSPPSPPTPPPKKSKKSKSKNHSNFPGD